MNKIICGDALAELKKMEKESVDLILTSPPYWGQRSYSDNDLELGNEVYRDQYLEGLEAVFDECIRVVKRTGSIVFNIGDRYIKGDLQLMPYRFAIRMQDRHNPALKLINDITWVKSNPTPRQHKRRLISSTEPFFHFVRYEHMFYCNPDAYLEVEKVEAPKKVSPRKGEGYASKIQNSDLKPKEKLKALTALIKTVQEVRDGNISDFRMKIRGVHAKAFGGQAGGRNSQIEKQGFTIIKMYGSKLKRDVIVNAVANTKDIDHPAVFPLKVITEMIKLLSKENDVILDPFCGSGQVCVASKLLNRRYLGIDLKKEYCELAENRVSKVESLI
jgi:DNA modification methylase